jgi:hypothetical protein
VDSTAQVVCTAVSAGVEITVGVGRSDLGGTESRVQVSDAAGETIGGGQSTSAWGDDTFRAVIPVVDNNEQALSEVYFSGRYQASGPSEQTQSRFNVGNVHVVEEHTETGASVTDVVIRYRDLTFTDPDCGAWLSDGSLFFHQPGDRNRVPLFPPVHVHGIQPRPRADRHRR